MAQIFDGQLRFGIHSGQQHTSYADYLALWQAAEAMGYDWASVFDHFIPIHSDPLGPCFEGLTLLAALAAQTTRIRCGMLVIGNTYRHPAVLANAAVTIDHISGGRLELGIGAGWWEMEHREYSIDYPSPGRRIRMLGEAAQVLRRLWTEPRASFAGRYYTLTDALCEPKPVQQPLPLWIGGAGEQLTLRMVAESADGWNTFLLPVDEYQRKLDALAGHCRDLGRDPSDIRKSLAVQAAIGRDRAEAQTKLEALARRQNMPIEHVTRRALVGTPEEAAEQLLPYVALGVHDILISARPPADMVALETIIERVAPLVRQESRRRGYLSGDRRGRR